jgi:hypothetical protein
VGCRRRAVGVREGGPGCKSETAPGGSVREPRSNGALNFALSCSVGCPIDIRTVAMGIAPHRNSPARRPASAGDVHSVEAQVRDLNKGAYTSRNGHVRNSASAATTTASGRPAGARKM